MRILLTGACGYVGSSLLPLLEAASHEVTALDTQWFYENPRVRKANIRSLDLSSLPNVDCIIHLAAIANDPSVAFYPRLSWETGVLATQQLAQWALETGCRRFIYASSVSVYGADRGMVRETDSVHPVSDYNRTKMCAERVLLSYPELRPQIVRPATICGLSPRMRLDLTVNLFTMQALESGVIKVHGGKQWRPSIHIRDMCRLYTWLLTRPDKVGIWNAGFENHALLTIAEIVQAQMRGYKVAIEVQQIEDKRSYQVSSEKLLTAGFRPERGISDAVDEIVEAYERGKLRNQERWYNLQWMQHLALEDK